MRFFCNGSDVTDYVRRTSICHDGRDLDLTRIMPPTHCPVCGQKLAVFFPGAPTMRCHVAGTNWAYEHAYPGSGRGGA